MTDTEDQPESSAEAGSAPPEADTEDQPESSPEAGSAPPEADAEEQPESSAEAGSAPPEADAEDERQSPTPASDTGSGPEDRIAALDSDIQGVRQRVADELEGEEDENEDDRRFVESGAEGEVDDTIAPPG